MAVGGLTSVRPLRSEPPIVTASERANIRRHRPGAEDGAWGAGGWCWRRSGAAAVQAQDGRGGAPAARVRLPAELPASEQHTADERAPTSCSEAGGPGALARGRERARRRRRGGLHRLALLPPRVGARRGASPRPPPHPGVRDQARLPGRPQQPPDRQRQHRRGGRHPPRRTGQRDVRLRRVAGRQPFILGGLGIEHYSVSDAARAAGFSDGTGGYIPVGGAPGSASRA